MRVSIVMAYYNRQQLLDKTMESIAASAIKDYELIIIDDGSNIPVVCDRANKILRIEPKKKWWHNPCIPFNVGFKEATGDIIIIQNPECYHVGDILTCAINNVKLNTYLSFGCYALNSFQTELFRVDTNSIFIENRKYRHPENNGWYNHPIHRPCGYHFCSAIMKEDLDKLGGFDEKYANGISFDDDDFIRRIKRMGMFVNITEFPYVLHQYHTPFTYQKKDYRKLHQINKKLFNG
jgi:glycosyltransferase involved in cell wall biosynthesis